jgi:hypothetical protein
MLIASLAHYLISIFTSVIMAANQRKVIKIQGNDMLTLG